MFDDPIMLSGAYVAVSASISAIMAKVSPTVGPRVRSLFAGVAPMGAVFANLLEGHDSVTLHGEHLLFGGGLLAAGTITAALVGRFVRTDSRQLPRA
ncbi:MAG: hypothetical protein R3E14_12970 [Erythrobacter sp.]